MNHDFAARLIFIINVNILLINDVMHENIALVS